MGIENDIQQRKFASEYQKLTVNILYTSSWLRLRTLKMLKPYGISPEQFNILRILRGQYPKAATVNLLIERMIDKTSNASRIVEKLRTKGLVDRKTSKVDRRVADVIITQKGLDLLKQIEDKQDSPENFIRNITAAEAATINALLDKIREEV